MEIRRFFVNPEDITDGIVTLRGGEFYHLTKVLRYKVGYRAYVMANDGSENLCEVKDISRDCAKLTILESKIADRKNAKVTLYAGLLKNNKLDFTVQKAVELGVDRIVPFISANCSEDKFNVERAEKIALEAAKQCGSLYLTSVGSAIDYDSLIREFAKFDIVLFAYEFEKDRRIKDVEFSGRNVALIVGPEGGFTSEEAAKAREAGAQTVTLGRRILRAETAGIILSAFTLDALGEFDEQT